MRVFSGFIPSILCIVTAISAPGCIKGPAFMKQQGSPAVAAAVSAAIVNDSDGILTATLDPNASGSQLVEASQSSAIAGTAVNFPAGSLAIATEVTVQEGAALASQSFSDQLGIDSSVTLAAAAPTILVESGKSMDTAQPFTIAISLGAGLKLADATPNYAVLYNVTDVSTGSRIAGLIPPTELKIEGGKVLFSTTHFGAFQLVTTSSPVAATKIATTQAVVSAQQAAAAPLVFSGIAPFIAGRGGVITVSGSNFRPTMTIALGGKPVSQINTASDVSATFMVPTDASFGLTDLTIQQDGVTSKAQFFALADKTDLPLITLAPASVCSGIAYYDVNGKKQTGVKDCSGSPAACQADGAVGCVASVAFPAADRSKATSANIAVGVTVAGIVGTLQPSPAPCAVDGATACVANAAFPAADKSHATAASIASGVTIAGVTGSLQGSQGTCNVDGAVGCVTTAAFPAIDKSTVVASVIKTGVTLIGVAGSVQPSPPPCSTDGAGSCVVDGTVYKAAKLSNFALTDVKSGITIAGRTGSIATCSTEGVSGCITGGTFVSADTTGLASKVLSGSSVAGVNGNVSLPTIGYVNSGTTYGPGGSMTGTLVLPTAANVRVAFGNYGIGGTSIAPNLGDCATDGASGCVISTGFLAADMTHAIASNIVSGATIAGVSGTAPAAGCSMDGETSCVTTARFKAMDTDNSVISPWDIRKGKSAGGIVGELAFFKNLALTSLFDRTVSYDQSITGLDPYDTLDDLGAPNEAPLSWLGASNAAWLRDPVSDTDHDGLCNGGEDCIFMDQMTGELWTSPSGTAVDWDSAITYCGALTLGSHPWRLPTQKEILQAYTDGIWFVSTPLGIASQTFFWSATTDSTASLPTYAFEVDVSQGKSTSTYKSTNLNALCVAP